MIPIEWAELYQGTAAICNWQAWETAYQNRGVSEEFAESQVSLGRWLASEAGQEWAQNEESSDGYRWIPRMEAVESDGFRGCAHGGFSQRENLIEMRPEMVEGRYQLTAR